jgi:hypothetical protein
MTTADRRVVILPLLAEARRSAGGDATAAMPRASFAIRHHELDESSRALAPFATLWRFH